MNTLEIFNLAEGQFEGVKDKKNFYWKEVARVGVFTGGNGKGGIRKVELTPEFFDELVKNFNTTDEIPIPRGHDGMNDPAKNTGWVRGLERRGNSLWALMEITEPEIAEKIDRGTIKSDSVGIVFKETVGRIVEHIALTIKPAITALGGFVPAVGFEDVAVYDLETKSVKEVSTMDPKELEKQLEEAKAAQAAAVAELEAVKTAEKAELEAATAKLKAEKIELEVARLVKENHIKPSQVDMAKKQLLSDKHDEALAFLESCTAVATAPAESAKPQGDAGKKGIGFKILRESEIENKSLAEMKVILEKCGKGEMSVMPDRAFDSFIDRNKDELHMEYGEDKDLRVEFAGIPGDIPGQLNLLNTGSFFVPKIIEAQVLMKNEGRYFFKQIAVPATSAKSNQIQWNVVGTLDTRGTSIGVGTMTGSSVYTISTVTMTPQRYGRMVRWSEEIADWGVSNQNNIAVQLLTEDYRQCLDTEAYKVLIAGNATVSANTLVCGTWCDGGFGTLQNGSVGTWSNALLSPKNIVMAKTKLSMNRARKIGDAYVAFCSPEQLYSLQNGTAWITSRNYADTTKLLNGEVGMYMGVRFVETDIISQYPVVHIIAAGTGTHFNGVVVGAEALGEGWDKELQLTYYNDDPLVADAGYTKRLQWNARGNFVRLKDDNVVVLSTSRDLVFGG